MVFGVMSCVYTYRDDRKKKSSEDNQEEAESTRVMADEKHPLLDGTVSDTNGLAEVEESLQPSTTADSDM